MEYFLGSLLTILTLIFAAKVFSKAIARSNPIKISYTQSYIHDLVGPLQPSESFIVLSRPMSSQAQKHQDRVNIRVLFVDGKAYWIRDNQFMVAEAENGAVISNTTTTVDTMAMNSVELDKMSFIVAKLTEGKNSDSGNTGNPQL